MAGLWFEQFKVAQTSANFGMTGTTFPKPVFVGDTIRSQTTVKDKRPSRSPRGQGIVTFEHLGLNQRDEIDYRTIRSALMMARPA